MASLSTVVERRGRAAVDDLAVGLDQAAVGVPDEDGVARRPQQAGHGGVTEPDVQDGVAACRAWRPPRPTGPRPAVGGGRRPKRDPVVRSTCRHPVSDRDRRPHRCRRPRWYAGAEPGAEHESGRHRQPDARHAHQVRSLGADLSALMSRSSPPTSGELAVRRGRRSWQPPAENVVAQAESERMGASVAPSSRTGEVVGHVQARNRRGRRMRSPSAVRSALSASCSRVTHRSPAATRRNPAGCPPAGARRPRSPARAGLDVSSTTSARSARAPGWPADIAGRGQRPQEGGFFQCIGGVLALVDQRAAARHPACARTLAGPHGEPVGLLPSAWRAAPGACASPTARHRAARRLAAIAAASVR